MASEAPYAQQLTDYHAIEERRMLSRLPIQAGVVAAGDLKVTNTGVALQVSMAVGDAWIAGSHAGVSRQGLYPVRFNAVETLTLAAGHATLPRIDQIVARIRDGQPSAGIAGDAENTGKYEIVQGTATSGATLANRSGATALPASSLRIADVLVPATYNAAFVQNTHIRDRRLWAHGAHKRITRSANAGGGNDYTTSSSSLVAIDSTNLAARIECSGRELELIFNGSVAGAATNNVAKISFMQDGVVIDGDTNVGTEGDLSVAGHNIEVIQRLIPPAGSYIFQPAFAVSTGTLTLPARADWPLHFIVREVMNQNASNDGA